MDEMRMEKMNLVDQCLRSKQRLISLLLFIFPGTVVSCILYQQGVLVRLNTLQLIIVLLLLVLAYSGVTVLRQYFEKFVMISDFLKRAGNGETVQMDVEHDLAELRQISVSFNRLVSRVALRSLLIGRTVCNCR